MWKFLAAPYPFFRNRITETLAIIAIGLFITAFLLIFEPFGTAQFQAPNRILFLAGYGLIVIVIGLLARFLIPFLFPGIFSEERWTVAHQIVWMFSTYLLVIITCYGYWALYFGNRFSLLGGFGFALLASSIGIFPLSAVIVLDYIALLKKYQRLARAETSKLVKPDSIAAQWVVLGQGEAERLSLDVESLCYIRAAGNYVEVIYHSDNELITDLVRATLQGVITESGV